MKLFLIRSFSFFFLFNYSMPTAYSCFCFTTDYCSYIEIYNTEDHPTLLAFKGSYIQSAQSGTSVALQFKVDKIYFGDIVTPDSPFYDGEEFINTDSTVWLLSGTQAACKRNIYETDAIFVVPYKTGLPYPSETFGYVPSICFADYFPISDENKITGPIWSSYEDETMDVSEFEQVILNECSTITSLDKNISEAECINIFPLPSDHIINLELCNNVSNWNIKLYDRNGKHVKNVTGPEVDISNLDNGVYYLIFTEEGGKNKYSRKVIKI